MTAKFYQANPEINQGQILRDAMNTDADFKLHPRPSVIQFQNGTIEIGALTLMPYPNNNMWQLMNSKNDDESSMDFVIDENFNFELSDNTRFLKTKILEWLTSSSNR